MSLDILAERSAELFSRCFGHSPRWIVAAPGRVNLIGEHTDYNEGYVLPMAIERHTVIAADTNNRREVTLHSVTTGETATFSARPPLERGQPPWSNYVRGVIAGFHQRGHKVGGFDAVIDSTVPWAVPPCHLPLSCPRGRLISKSNYRNPALCVITCVEGQKPSSYSDFLPSVAKR